MDFPALNLDDPKTMGILALASGLLQAGGPSRTPVPFGTALGQGFTNSMNTMNQMKQAAMQQELLRQHAALYGIQGDKLKEDIDRQRKLAGIMGESAPQPIQLAQNGVSDSSATSMGAPWAAASTLPQPQTASPLDAYKAKATKLVGAGFLKEGNEVADFVKKMEPELEFKDGVWYDKRSGAPVRGGAGINQQGFGYQTNLGPNGQISVGELPGAAGLYLGQQRIGERARAERDLVTVPPSGPNSAPSYASRESLLAGKVPAGMSPSATSAQAADAGQQAEIAKNYGKIFNDLQNGAMQNPAKIAKFQQIGSLLNGFEGGKFSKTGLEIARAANSAGMKIDPKLPNKEAAEAMANEVALELRSTGSGGGMPGAMSDADRDFLKNMAPNMAQTDVGRKTIIDARVKVMQRENQVAGMARDYRKKYGKLDDDFFSQLQDWSGRNQIFGKK